MEPISPEQQAANDRRKTQAVAAAGNNLRRALADLIGQLQRAERNAAAGDKVFAGAVPNLRQRVADARARIEAHEAKHGTA